MGTSTDAILYFGFDFCNEESGDEYPWIDEQGEQIDWEEFYAAQLGIRDESGRFNQEGEYAFAEGTPERDRAEKISDDWYKKKSKVVKMSGCTIDTHCSVEFPVWFVALSEHMITAHRGYPQKASTCGIGPDEIEKLKQFCKVMGIRWRTPEWRLASYWG